MYNEINSTLGVFLFSCTLRCGIEGSVLYSCQAGAILLKSSDFNPFFSGCFEDRVLLFARASMGHNPFIL
jgi:hypothetical protein